MTTTLVLTLAFALGAGTRSRWSFLAPLVIGGVGLISIGLSGQPVGDTPIPFLIVVSTVAMAMGHFVRSRGAFSH